jgi:hypothetical protein
LGARPTSTPGPRRDQPVVSSNYKHSEWLLVTVWDLEKRWKRNIFLYFGMLYFFLDEKSSFGSLMSVIDPEGDIWLGPFNLHYFSTLDSFRERNFLPLQYIMIIKWVRWALYRPAEHLFAPTHQPMCHLCTLHKHQPSASINLLAFDLPIPDTLVPTNGPRSNIDFP